MTTSSNSKPNAIMRRRLEVTLLALASSNGHGDGKTFADCIACGNAAILGLSSRNPRGFNFGHMRSADNGGTWNLRNLAPMCRRCNAKLGTRNVADTFTPRYNVHAGWNEIILPDPGQYDSEIDSDEWLPV